MNYLIDTQILIWFQLNSKDLKNDTVNILVDKNNSIFISDISFIEIVIKQKINKIPEFNIDINDIINVCKVDGFIILPISHKHISNYLNIPIFEEHKDPFDRIILSTAHIEGLVIISADEKFKLYKGIVKLIEA